MNVKFIAKIFISMTIVLVSAIAIFVFFIPIDFYETVSGRVIPAKSMAISSPFDGTVTVTIKGMSFRKGDILAKLDSISDELALKYTTLELEQVQKQINWEKKVLAFSRVKLKEQLAENSFKADALKKEEQLQEKQLELYKSVVTSLHKHRKLEEKLRAEEARIFKSLFERKVVARIDFLKIAHQAHVAKIMSKQIKMDADRRLFDHESGLNQVKSTEKLLSLQKPLLEQTPEPLNNLLSLEAKLLELKCRIANLKNVINQKTIRAPYDGMILLRQTQIGAYIKKGTTLFDITDLSPMIFRASCNQNKISNIKLKQKAEITLDNFSPLKYGRLKATLKAIQTNLKNETDTYILDMTITENKLGKLQPGLTGTADIITSHETIFNYLMAKNSN